ncbi:MAG: nicotinate-nucleotide adenylyltransferase [Ignavibacteriales bacterium]|nr:nicotinate-nucleotide adenylyltransferase [Ignavibacteriales bacterium]
MPAQLNNIGIFGGSFDPPHLGHLVIAEFARRALKLDVVFLVPAYQPPHKTGKHTSTAQDRLAMTKLSVRGNPHLRVSDIEIRRKGISYTVDTVRAFQKKFPSSSLFLIIGSDSLEQFNSWKDPDAILALASLAVYRRPGWRTAKSKEGRVTLREIKGPRMKLASSEIRKRLHDGKAIDEMVRENVFAYIMRNRLYERVTEKREP